MEVKKTMKTLNFGLSKILNDLGLLDNIETEYCYFEGRYIAGDNKEYICDKLQLTPYFNGIKESISSEYKLDYDDFTITIIKTLTPEEAIEFLPNRIENDNNAYYLTITKAENKYHICYNSDLEDYVENGIEIFKSCILNNEHIFGKTPLEAIEKMIEYLLDNNLLLKLNRYDKRNNREIHSICYG